MLTTIFRFTGVGIVGAICDYLPRLLLLHLGVIHPAARALSYVSGSAVAYLLNSKLTFAGNRSTQEKLRATVSYLACFCAAVAVDHVVQVAFPGAPHLDTISWVVSQGAATVLNFTLQYAWVFRAADKA